MSSNSSPNHLLTNCFESRMTNIIFTCQFIADVVFILPVLLYVVYVGLQRRRQQRSCTSTAAVMSHSDYFTYNMMLMDVMSILASGFYCFGAYSRLQWVGYSMFSLTIPGQTLFHLLTCVERYLAVVHPITYLGLKQAPGLKARNISSGCVWLLCCSMVGVIQVISTSLLTFLYVGLMAFFLVIVCFCTLSILRVLRHPGPGQASGEQVDPSKQRAFHTVVAIQAALMCRLVAVLLCSVMFSSWPPTDLHCAVGSSAMWVAAPGSLVLPLLFLQRAGKLPGGRKLTRDRTRET